MKIAIGPIEGHYGGAAQHILNIIKNSSHQFDKIEIPRYLKEWGKFFRKYILPIQEKLPHSLEHSDKRFDMYGLQKYLDVTGFIQSRFYLPRYNVVHLHGYPYWEKIYDTRTINSVFTVHNLYRKEDFLKNWERTIEILTKKMLNVCRGSKVVISVAKWLQKTMREEYGIKSIYIPNGVNLEEFDKRDGEAFRKKFGVDDDFYLFVGRATKYKRPELFVALAEKMPSRKFLMIGRGLTKKELVNYVGKRLPQNLLCIGEPERKDVVNAFDACRVFILPSTNETFGIVFLEGMLSQKPVIGANHLGPAEIINHGKTGFLFEPENLEDLLIQAEYAWNAQEVGLAGREEVERSYDWKKIVSQIDEVYENVERNL